MRPTLATAALMALLTAAALPGAALAASPADDAPASNAAAGDSAAAAPATHKPVAKPAVDAMAESEKVRVERLLGLTVIGADGEELGEVTDVLLDAPSGAVTQIVVASGGFLGMGEKQIAVDYDAVTFNNENQQVEVRDLTRKGVEGLDAFSYSDRTTSLNRPAAR